MSNKDAIKEMNKVKKLIKDYIGFKRKYREEVYFNNNFDADFLENVHYGSFEQSNEKGKGNMDNNSDILQRIDDFHEFSNIDNDTLESVVSSVVALSNDQEKKEIYAKLTAKIGNILSESLKNGKIEVSDFENKVSVYRDKLKTYANFSDIEVADLFRLNGLAVDPNELVSKTSTQTQSGGESLSQEEIEKEIAKLEFELTDVFIAAKAANMTPRDYLNAEIKRIEEEKANQIKQINEEIDKTRDFVDYDANAVQEEIEMYQNQERQLIGLGVEEDNKDVVEIRENIRKLEKRKNDNEKYIDDALVEEIEMYQNQERQLIGLAVEEDNKDVVEIRENIRKLEELREDNKNIDAIRKEIAELERLSLTGSVSVKNESSDVGLTEEQINKQLSALKEEQQELWRKVTSAGDGASDEEQAKLEAINKEIARLENELQKVKNSSKVSTSSSGLTEEQINEQLSALKEEQQELWRKVTSAGDGASDEEQAKLEAINKEIARLENELQKVKNSPKVSTSNSGLTAEQQKRLDELKQKLAAVEEKREQIKNSAQKKIDELEDKKKKIQSKADKDVEALKDKLNKLDRLEYLKGLRKKKDQSESKKRPDLFWKSMAGLVGFAVGMGTSFIPGYGTIRMGIASAKLIVSAINTGANVWSKNFPEGKIAKFVAWKDNKMAELSDKEKHPKIATAVKIIKSPYTKWFTNGAALGHMAGSLLQSSGLLNKGDSIPTDSVPKDPELDDTIIKDSIPDQTPIDSTPTPTPISNPVDPGLEIGEKFNDTLEFGFRDSYGNGFTHLRDVGPGKAIEKIRFRDGEYWAHILQPNGQGLAWMPVQDLANEVGQPIIDEAGKVLAEPIAKAVGRSF